MCTWKPIWKSLFVTVGNCIVFANKTDDTHPNYGLLDFVTTTKRHAVNTNGGTINYRISTWTHKCSNEKCVQLIKWNHGLITFDNSRVLNKAKLCSKHSVSIGSRGNLRYYLPKTMQDVKWFRFIGTFFILSATPWSRVTKTANNIESLLHLMQIWLTQT